MAADQALLDAVERGEAPATLRLYSWLAATVSLGRHQLAPDPGAAASLAAHGVGWVRRPTGGRAVYHGPAAEELTYAVVAPLDRGPLAGGARAAHRWIHAGLAAGLARLGVAAALVPRAAAARSARPAGPAGRLACFAAAVPDEIAAGGRKLVGSAQRRTRRALLQHGSVPLAGDQAPLRAAWPGCLPPDAFTTVARAAGRTIAPAEVATALVRGLAGTLNVSFRHGVWSEREREAIAARIEPLAMLDPL